MRAPALAPLVLVLAACAGAPQPVTTEAQAIHIAMDRCAFTRLQAALWHARLHDGQWHVWLVPDGSQREPAIGALDLWIQAKNGDAGDCNHAR